MRRHETRLPAYPRVEAILDAIAEWIRRYRYALGIRAELAQCSPEDVAAIAQELGINANELPDLASKGPSAADPLKKMLRALHVDPNKLLQIDSQIAQDLRRMCITCSNKTRCARELAGGTAAENYHEYCPNAVTLDALFGPARTTTGEDACPACDRSAVAEPKQETSIVPSHPFPPSSGRLAARSKHDTHH